MRLREFTPSRTQFSHTLSDASLRMGFECEVMLPEDSDDDDGDGDYEVDWDAEQDRINDMSWSDLHVGRLARGRVTEAYQGWLGEQIEAEWQTVAATEVRKYCIDNDLIAGPKPFPWSDWLSASTSTSVRAYAEKQFPNWVQPIMILWNAIGGQKDDLQAVLERCKKFGDLAVYGTNLDEVTEVAKKLYHVPEPDEEKEYEDEDKVLSDDDNITNAKDEWKEKEDFDEQYSMDDFIEDAYDNMSRFCAEFDIEIEPDEDNYHRSGSGESVNTVHRNAAEDLESVIGYDVLIGHGGADDWHVEEDSSLSGEGTGMEIVSPVFTMVNGLASLKKVFEWIENSASTNSTTGLHVSFSIVGKTEDDYDYLKMIMLFDENYTAKIFKRLSNTFAQQIRTNVFISLNNITDIGKLPERSISAMIDRLRTLSPQVHNISSKYFSFRHRENGVFEFRTMGNAGYQNRFDTIRKRIIAMALIMKVGADPNLMAREYLSRIYRMLTTEKFSSSGPTPKPFTPSAILSSFANIWSGNAALSALSINDPTHFLEELAVTLKVSLRPQQIRQLRLYAKKHGLRPDMYNDLRLYNRNQYNVLANYLRWPIVVPSDARQATFPFAQPGPMNPEKSRADD